MTVWSLCCISLICILIKSWNARQTGSGRTIASVTSRGSTAHVSSNLSNLPEEEEEVKPCLRLNAVVFMLTCNHVGGCCWGGFCAIFDLLWSRRVPAHSPLWSVWCHISLPEYILNRTETLSDPNNHHLNVSAEMSSCFLSSIIWSSKNSAFPMKKIYSKTCFICVLLRIV